MSVYDIYPCGCKILDTGETIQCAKHPSIGGSVPQADTGYVEFFIAWGRNAPQHPPLFVVANEREEFRTHEAAGWLIERVRVRIPPELATKVVQGEVVP